jgi:hypothetical protein
MTNYFEEQFEAVGFDETGWSEVEAGAGALDVDATPPVSGWGSRCLHAETFGGISDSAYGLNTGLTAQNVTFFRWETVIDSHSLGDGVAARILTLFYGGGTDIACSVRIKNVSGTLYLEFWIQQNGVDLSKFLSSAISLDTKIIVHVNWDIDANTWAWRVDDVEQDSGSLSGAAASWQITGVLAGMIGTSNRTASVYCDNIYASTTEYPAADLLVDDSKFGRLRPPANDPLIGKNGVITETWRLFFEKLSKTTRIEVFIEIGTQNFEVNNNWRLLPSVDNLLYQRLESGVWTTKDQV